MFDSYKTIQIMQGIASDLQIMQGEQLTKDHPKSYQFTPKNCFTKLVALNHTIIRIKYAPYNASIMKQTALASK